MSKCKACPVTTKEACISKLNPEFKMASNKKVKTGKSFVGVRGAKDQFGNYENTGTHQINLALLSGGFTVQEIAEKIDSPISRVKTHFYSLTKKQGHQIVTGADKKVSIVVKTAIAA
jgi:DNA-binding NarL/FixJ family response regulator